MCSWSRLRRGCPRLRLVPGCRLGAGMTAEEGTRAKNKRRGIRWCAPLCTVACSFLFCHSGLRAGILGGFMRGIVLPLIASPVFIPRQHPPGSRIKCGMTAQTRRLCCHRGRCRVLPPLKTLHATSLPSSPAASRTKNIPRRREMFLAARDCYGKRLPVRYFTTAFCTWSATRTMYMPAGSWMLRAVPQ